MKKETLIKVIGFAATAISVGASLVTSWVNDKNLDAKVNETVTKALAEQASKVEL